MTEQTENTPKRPSTKQLAIRRIYIKDLSFEAPMSPLETESSGKSPSISLNLRSDHSEISENLYEVVLIATVEATVEDATVFLAEVHQAGAFECVDYTETELDELLGALCPSQLFPFVRETICDLVLKGGFPQLQLQPVNFLELYLKRRATLDNAQAAS
ncbi:MAG: protein-export chaperone SecB [Gammaproteobacteria bacterium]